MKNNNVDKIVTSTSTKHNSLQTITALIILQVTTHNCQFACREQKIHIIFHCQSNKPTLQ